MNQQTDQERGAIFSFYVASKWAHPSVDYDSLQTIQALVARCSRDRYPHLEVRHIVAECLNADLAGELRHKAQKEVVVVEVEKQPTESEKAEAAKKEKKRRFEAAHAAGLRNRASDNKNELDRDDQYKKPPMTEEQRVALNQKNRRIDEIVTETLSSIGNYQGPSHARTFERREQLRETFNKFKNQVTDEASALKLQRTINEKIDSYDRGSSGGIR